ncbi:PSD1 and planctomycete cytochrome C domain-containing protein [Bremerella volcania]|nr:PSD1 and planctomycete cytochrome C domain-containing protein [Bremerella volcania]
MWHRLYFILSVVALSYATVRAEERIDFNRQIRPILSDRCFQCHGPDEEERYGGFRLDVRDGAIQAADSGSTPIVPGKPDESELLLRVVTDDASIQMPPPEAKKPHLTKQEAELIKTWIEQGAAWSPHWSFVAPKRPQLPAVKNSEWIRNPIDRFILARLEKEGLTPSAEADRRTLIRRVTLDLVGLPPTPQEVDAFIADESPEAYERLVDRLLASPHYGERMAWPWLDAARYADTNGYQGDPERTMWPWRDWVVDALNNNMPFDQFTLDQLAGDQRPNATHAQVIASGFNRNHMHNGEGGRIAEETRVENVFDRTETTATVWLGLTFTCCRCHTHKFDPITNTEYFALYDFFNQTSEAGGIRGGAVPPAITYISEENRAKLNQYDQQLARLNQTLLNDDPAADSAQAIWEEEQRAVQPWTMPTLVDFQTSGKSKLVQLEDGSLRAEGARPDQDVYTIVARTDRENLKSIRLEAIKDDVASPAGSTGRADNGNAVLSEFEVFVRPLKSSDENEVPLKIASGKAEHAQSGHPLEAAFDGQNAGGGGWATEGFRRKESNTAIFNTKEPFGFEGGTEIRFVIRCESQHIAHTLARVRLSVGDGDGKESLSPEIWQALNKPSETRSSKEANALRRLFRSKYYPGGSTDGKTYQEVSRQIQKAEADRKKLRETLDKTKVMVMDTLEKGRETRILEKGLYNKPIGDVVSPGVPSVLPALPDDAPRDRLALAKWLVESDNPLTSRVIVNRYWQLFFGQGLVTTPEDFGTQGKRPSHPDLLDWLAVEFQASGWDVKAIHRLIVTSATYRQSAQQSPQLRERDPQNVLLARQNRFRLPSWMIRDQALSVSGLASLQMGGPPVKPYQPEGIWAEATFGKKKYQQDHGDALYRRSLYVFWRRIVGPTMFFDVANRQTCSVETAITNTPLHALTTLNDIAYIEAARGLATRVISKAEDPGDRIREIYSYLLSRPPSEEELGIVRRRLELLESEFNGDPEKAKQLLEIGESQPDDSIPAVELAAYTALCNALMNLDEVLNRP